MFPIPSNLKNTPQRSRYGCPTCCQNGTFEGHRSAHCKVFHQPLLALSHPIESLRVHQCHICHVGVHGGPGGVSTKRSKAGVWPHFRNHTTSAAIACEQYYGHKTSLSTAPRNLWRQFLFMGGLWGGAMVLGEAVIMAIWMGFWLSRWSSKVMANASSLPHVWHV